MLANFFQFGPIPANQMTGYYDLGLVLLSYLVAFTASYIALDITGRLRDIGNTKLTDTLWLFGGSLAMGAGIWSMHFIGMLAFIMPMPMSYDAGWTFFSMLIAVLASGFALLLLKTREIHIRRLALGGILLGLAIASMHYTGMEAMRVNMNIHYLPGIFCLSIIIAIIASEAALWLALKSNQGTFKARIKLKFISALIMGAAICGMHYTGMAAAIFTPLSTKELTHHSMEPQFLSSIVAIVSFIILSIAFIASSYKEITNLRALAVARQKGMAEVASSVLHNIGNVLTSLNVSASMIMEKIIKSELKGLLDVNELLTRHKNDLITFISQDKNAANLALYIQELTIHWQTEQELLTTELKKLSNNIQHIKDIIAKQQDISGSSNMEELVDISEVLDSALAIMGINFENHKIKFTKEYKKLHPVLVDKVKLIQIIINLIRNAKDALIESKTNERTLILRVTHSKKEFFCIQVIDNGMGVAPENQVRIFAYGFTTKAEGHGYGLHASAIAANEMGGALKMKSQGIGHGSTFSIELPYKQNLNDPTHHKKIHHETEEKVNAD